MEPGDPFVLWLGGRTVFYHETNFTDLRDEGRLLFAEHWREASADTSVPLDLDWEVYRALEATRALMTVAVRSDGVLIGYSIYLIHSHLHYRGYMVADSDAFFVRESDRKGLIGIRLFQVSEALARARGVHEIRARVKKHVRPGRGRSDLGPVFERLGYRETEVVYRKRIG